ncbi:MAG: response regulator [Elusimicrobiota bacterium]
MEKSKIKILVVDDEPQIRDIIARFLKKGGYQVCLAADGEEAVQALKNERPHLVLLDIRMPKMDGITALKEIKKIDPTVGVIMTTAFQDEEIAKTTIALGACDYICKPLDLFSLENSILAKVIMMLD